MYFLYNSFFARVRKNTHPWKLLRYKKIYISTLRNVNDIFYKKIKKNLPKRYWKLCKTMIKYKLVSMKRDKIENILFI